MPEPGGAGNRLAKFVLARRKGLSFYRVTVASEGAKHRITTVHKILHKAGWVGVEPQQVMHDQHLTAGVCPSAYTYGGDVKAVGN